MYKNRTWAQIRHIGHKNVKLKNLYEDYKRSPKMSNLKIFTIELTFPLDCAIIVI
jgi:hypothetical protein